ncbi:hypothetical protein M0813_07391 [Anaeramoeba flamelloides]|nr:hypothetical protein M0813_07391 [Anaeramoeba flamelloides]
MIFESLSPIKLGILKQTNSFFREICQDPELWRRCCLNYEHLFIWDNLIIGRFRNETVINGDLSNLNNSVKTDLINQTNADRPPLLTCSKTRREYIKTLKDPESEIIKKIKTLKRIYKEKKIANKKQETEYVKSIVSREYFSKVGSCLRIYLFPCVPIVFTIFTILLNLYMEKIWITKPIFVLIPVILLLIGGLLTILLPLIKAFNRYVFLPLGIGTLVFSVFNNAFVFHLLRYYEIIHLGPMLLVVPMAISLIIILSAYLYYSNPRRARLLRHWAAYISAGLFLCFAAFLLIWFLYRLGLKINDHDSMSLRETLFPLYIFDILPFFIPLIFICLGNSLREALILLMWIGVCYAALFIPFIVFEILIVLYLETSKISNFFMVMIPIYIWDIILFIIAKIYVTMLL